MYSVISVIVDSLPGNTKNRESTRSWTASEQLVHSWAGRDHRWNEVVSKMYSILFSAKFGPFSNPCRGRAPVLRPQAHKPQMSLWKVVRKLVLLPA